MKVEPKAKAEALAEQRLKQFKRGSDEVLVSWYLPPSDMIRFGWGMFWGGVWAWLLRRPGTDYSITLEHEARFF